MPVGVDNSPSVDSKLDITLIFFLTSSTTAGGVQIIFRVQFEQILLNVGSLQ